MPRKCSVPLCRTNYRGSKNFSTFGFPKDPELRDKWLKAICRKDWVLPKHGSVCILHFEERFIVREMTAIRNDGSVLVVPLMRPRLIKESYPTLFYSSFEFIKVTCEDVPDVEDPQSGEILLQQLNSSRVIRNVKKVQSPLLPISYNSPEGFSVKSEGPFIEPEEPSIMSDRHFTETEKPFIKSEELLIESEEPFIESEEPFIESEGFLIKSEELLIDSEEPFIEPEEPSIMSDRHFTETEEPFIKSEGTFIQTKGPFIKSEEPLIESEGLWIKSEELLIDSEEPFIEPEEPSEEPFIGSEEPFIESEGLLIKSEELLIDSEEPFIDSEEPFFESEGLLIKSEELLIDSEELFNKPLAGEKPYCKTCDIQFDGTNELHVHLLKHVKFPFIVLTRLKSED